MAAHLIIVPCPRHRHSGYTGNRGEFTYAPGCVECEAAFACDDCEGHIDPDFRLPKAPPPIRVTLNRDIYGDWFIGIVNENGSTSANLGKSALRVVSAFADYIVEVDAHADHT